MPSRPSTASDTRGSRPSSGWLCWAPVGVLVVAGVILALLWPSLPARWVVHWGPRGVPDGWAEKTVLGVYMPLLFGIILIGVLEAITRITVRYGLTPRSPQVSPEAVQAMAAGTAECIRWIALGIALVCAGLALVLPLLHPVRVGLVVVGVIGVVVGCLALGLWRLWRCTRTLRDRGLGEGLEGWHGLYYRNPQDPRIWVPKLLGMGYTLNFAHRRAWVWFIVMLGIPLLVVALAFRFALT